MAIVERVRAAVRSCTAYLATTEPARAKIAAAHAQLVAAYAKDMADADGKMLAEYGAIDVMEPLPQGASWTWRRRRRSMSTSRSSTLCFV